MTFITKILVRAKLQLAGLTLTFFQTIQYIFFTNVYGVSVYSDKYFAIMVLLANVNLILFTPFDQLIYFLKEDNNLKSYVLDLIKISFIFSILMFVLFLSSKGFIMQMFFADVYTEDLEFKKTMTIGLISVILQPAINILKNLLIFKNRITWTLYIQCISPLFILAVLFYQNIEKKLNIAQLLSAYTLGNLFIFSLLIILFTLEMKTYKRTMKFNLNSYTELFRQSFHIRFSGNIHTFLLNLIINNYLIKLGQGIITIYSYAEKAVISVVNSIHGPMQFKFMSLVSRKSNASIKNEEKEYLKGSIIPFVLFCVVLFFLIPIIFPLINKEINESEIRLIKWTIVLLASWKLVTIIESVPIIKLQHKKEFKIFYLVNSLFIILYYTVSKTIIKGYYGLFLVLIILTIVNTLFYTIQSKKE